MPEAQRSIFDMLAAAGGGLGSGILQGATLGGADELFADSDIAGAQQGAPMAFSLGSAIGSIPWAALGARASAGAAKGPLSRLLASSALGAAHGGAAGAFGMTPGDMSEEDRLVEAVAMALMGGAVGGLAVPATRAAMDLDDNLPALIGRRRAEDGSTTQTRPGQGTRKSAPLNVRLAGEGSADERAEMALRLGLNMDEFEALQQNARGKLDRYGESFRADSGKMGRSTRSLVDYAAQSPGGSERLNKQADELLLTRVRDTAKRAQLPARGDKAPKLKADKLNGFLAAADRPEYHSAWVRQAKSLPERQRFDLARVMVNRMRAQAKTASGGDAAALRLAMSDRQFLAKLRALGVTVDTGKLRPAANRDAEALRDRGRQRDNPDYVDHERGFANVDDRLLARRGGLSEADALALLDAAARPRSSFFTEPRRPADARLLAGEFEHGARFKPGSYFNGDDSKRNFNLGFMDLDASPTELAILASQPMAALLHGLPTWDDPRG